MSRKTIYNNCLIETPGPEFKFMKASDPKSNQIINKSRAYQRFLFVALGGISKGKRRSPRKSSKVDST